MGVVHRLAFILAALLVTVQGVRLGDGCSYDKDCEESIAQSFCERQVKCSCKSGFKPDETGEKCIATVGAMCRLDSDCSTLQYSECRQEVCECQSGYVPHSSETECLQEAPFFRAPCVENLQCTSSLSEGSHCFQEKCICLPQFHSYENKCIPNVGLGQKCNQTYECYINDATVNMVACKDMKCSCADGYQIDGNSCKGNGHRVILSVAALLFGLVASRLFS